MCIHHTEASHGNDLKMLPNKPSLIRERETGLPLLVVMTKWPASGRCKKRLGASLGLSKAAGIQLRLTEHTLTIAKSLEQKGLFEVQVAITDIAWKARRRLAKSWNLSNVVHQGQGNLGLRMRRQLIKAQKAPKRNTRSGGRSTLIIGTDLPWLASTDLLTAIERLKSKEMVLGPAKDGGYWLIGLSGKLLEPVATWPFCGIPWGSDKVLQKTIQLAQKASINYELLNEQSDIDRFEDLSPWHRVQPKCS